MSQIAKYYYEAHVTIEPVFDERLAQAQVIARQHKFKVADLLMKKRERDSEERSKNDTFLTGHSKSYSDIQERVRAVVNQFKQEGFKVWRYKIEDTMLDSKFDDCLNILE